MTAPLRSILYVDDEPGSRLVFQHALEGLDVTCVESGAAALSFLEETPVAVVVADQRMPGMSGHELLTQVKERWPEVVRIVLTAYSDERSILRAVNEGLVARYLVKPWSADELRSVLTWAVDAHALAQDDSRLGQRLLATERLATIGAFSSSVVHDLVQPLSTVMLNHEWLTNISAAAPALSRMLQDGDDPSDTDRALLLDLAEGLASVCEETSETLELALGIVSTLRDLSRAPRENVTPSGSVARASTHAVRLCTDLSRRSSTRIRVEVAEDLPLVAVTTEDLTRVLLNLLVNSCQAHVRGETSGRSVSVRAREEAGTIRVEVSDNGPGMPAAVLAQARTLFFSTSDEGTGIGLHQCRRIVEGARGELELESTPGVGSVVRMSLPLDESG